MPFGLQGVPAVFMQLINEVLHDHLYKGVIVYLDDILIYTETREEHVRLVCTVLKKLRAAELYAKLSKCEFHQEKVDYLGYCISHRGIEMDPAKVKAVTEWEAPRTCKQLQKFWGFANFYRQFIPSFAKIALPITNLLKSKGGAKPKPSKPLDWTMDCQAAFEKLKRLFAEESVLKHPDMDAPFVVQADASDVAVGAVLLQANSQGLSSSHYPQTNGACERTNSVLEQYLRCFINYQQDDWVDLLPHAEVAYNNSVHSSTGFTPFRVMYGQDFVPIPEIPQEQPQVSSLSEWSDRLRGVWPLALQTLDAAHRTHKKQADKKRTKPYEYKERESLNASIVYAINQASDYWGIRCLRYEIKDIHVPPRVKESMQMQVEAERRKRATVLESEGIRESAINVAEGNKQAQILASEAEKTERINKAAGDASAILVKAQAKSEAIGLLSMALTQQNGNMAASFSVAEQYVQAFSQLAKESNTILLPTSTGDVTSMVTQAMSIYSSLNKTQAPPPESLEEPPASP
ncbi:PREDICTED: stomatin-like protein 2, mitochondrial, partial [Thamnophis sirtalis]|uniref:ribonuclease H n=1 Tax=Thamnophis sirtalis TaxID=35019 RepID=A0A6I9YU94_9SAUR